MKGGFGVGISGDRALAAAAFVAVNAFGHVCGADGAIIAAARADDRSLIDTTEFLKTREAEGSPAANTTIAVVALNVALSKGVSIWVTSSCGVSIDNPLNLSINYMGQPWKLDRVDCD